MSSAPTICVLGSLNMDLVVRAPRLPRAGETLLAGTFRTFSGGKGANQAVAIARLGGRVRMLGGVGGDDFGARLRAVLEEEGVDVERLWTFADEPSGVALITVEAGGENTILVAPGANHRLSPEHVLSARARIQSAAMLVMQLECRVDTVEAAARLAREAGVPVLLNAAPAAPLATALLAQLDTLVVNLGEAALLLGVEAPAAGADATGGADRALELARDLAELGPRRVVVTLGALGAVAVEQGGLAHRRGAFAVESVDAVAAGDAFVGALALRLAEGRALEGALLAACAAGALATTREGALPSLPQRAELEELLRRG